MNDAAIAVGFAIFIWWFSTGIVILLNRMSRSAIALSLVLSSLLGVAALIGLAHTAQQTSLTGAYCAFTCALLAWGWNELSFLTGWITGPRTTALPTGTVGWRRFVESFRAVQWHEIGILFYQYLLRSKSYFTIYLGQSLPYESLLIALDKVNPDILLTSWLTSVEEQYVKSYFKQLRTARPNLTILAGGAQIGIHQDVVSPFATLVQSSEVLLELLKQPRSQFSRELQ